MNGLVMDGVHRGWTYARVMPGRGLFILALFISHSGCVTPKITRTNPVDQSKAGDSSLDSLNESLAESGSPPSIPTFGDVANAPILSETTVSPLDIDSSSDLDHEGLIPPAPACFPQSKPHPPSLVARPILSQSSGGVSIAHSDFDAIRRAIDSAAFTNDDTLFPHVADKLVGENPTGLRSTDLLETDAETIADREKPFEYLLSTVDSKLKSNEKSEATEARLPRWMNLHVQATTVTQAHPSFKSPYVGPESFVPVEPSATSQTVTVYLAARFAKSTEVIFNPELITGQGLSNVFGIAAYPNGEMNRASTPQATPFIGRLLVRQVWGLGGVEEEIPDAFNQVAGTRDVDRVTLSVGKMAPTDIFDDNKYSHDPRTQFLDWALMYNSAWDYPADLRGYSYGGAIDLNRQDWALRYGVFAEPAVANQMSLDPRFLQAHGQVVELEERYRLKERSGKLRMLAYLNRAHMGSYAQSLAEMPVNPDIAATRDYRYKYGFGANLEQELEDDVGLFARLGWNDGHTESWAFTEMDSLASVGLSVMGSRWGRPQDQVGLAGVLGGLSSFHRAYLAAGGVGFQLGDGRLNYGLEKVVETYYRCELLRGIQLSTAIQGVENPGFNRDRGPVAIGTIRLHIEF